MNFRVTHLSTYHYAHRVPISYNRVCLTPRWCPHQECLRHEIAIDPAPAVTPQPVTDYYGNKIHHFSVQDPHDALAITAVSEVRLNPQLAPDPDSTPGWETVRDTLRRADHPETLRAQNMVATDEVYLAQDPAAFKQAHALLDRVVATRERLLGPDHPVTGGYPVIAVVGRASQAVLARLRAKRRLRFAPADAPTGRNTR